MSYFQNCNVLQLDCGYWHSLSLTSDGLVYAWGHNVHGEIGCGENKGRYITHPTQLKIFSKFFIKTILLTRKILCNYLRWISLQLGQKQLVSTWTSIDR